MKVRFRNSCAAPRITNAPMKGVSSLRGNAIVPSLIDVEGTVMFTNSEWLSD
jgi:hypothetical protein